MLTGLRGRLVAAMLLVSAVTLGVAAFALFTPLTNQLRDDEIETMVRAARAERHVFERLPGDSLRSDSNDLHSTARALRRGSGADVSVIGPGGRALYSTDIDNRVPTQQALRALRTGKVQRGTVNGEALVAVPSSVDGTRVAIELRKSSDGVESAVGVVRDAFLVAAAIGLAVALLVGLLLSRSLVRRLRALRDTALRVAELGPVVEVQADDSRDEVGDLTRALSTMQEHLSEQEQARRTFVSTASHELRTPLTSLSLMLDTLRRDLEEPADLESARRGAAGADAQAERLGGLAANLLDLSRLDAGLPPRTEPIETEEVARSVLAEFEVRITDHGGSITLVDGVVPTALGDPGSTAQIMRILVDNAIAHGGALPAVRVVIAGGADTVTVAVSDSGPGIPPADRDRMFERFERGDDASVVPGFGLGLSIARELAQRMGGTLTVGDAVGATTGACFTLTLPASA